MTLSVKFGTIVIIITAAAAAAATTTTILTHVPTIILLQIINRDIRGVVVKILLLLQ